MSHARMQATWSTLPPIRPLLLLQQMHICMGHGVQPRCDGSQAASRDGSARFCASSLVFARIDIAMCCPKFGVDTRSLKRGQLHTRAARQLDAVPG